METGSPSSTASASIPPTPQPSTPSPLTIVVCESVPISVSGNANGRPPLLPRLDHAREVLEIDLVDDPRVRRDDAEVVERALPPAEEGVALAVPLELPLGVAEDCHARAELVHLHRVVDDELGRDLRVDRRRVAAERHHRLAHGGKVDDRRHAREVLQKDTRGTEGDLVAGIGVGVPAGDRAHLVLAPQPERLRSEDVLEQDAQRVWKPRDVGLPGERVQPRDRVRPACRRRAVRVLRSCPPRLDSSRGLPAGGLRPGTDGRPRLRRQDEVVAKRKKPAQVPVAPRSKPKQQTGSLLTRRRVVVVAVVAAAVAIGLVSASLLSARGNDGGGGATTAIAGGPDVEAMLEGIPQEGRDLAW